MAQLLGVGASDQDGEAEAESYQMAGEHCMLETFDIDTLTIGLHDIQDGLGYCHHNQMQGNIGASKPGWKVSERLVC